MAKSEIFKKENVADSGKTLGAVAAGIVFSHAANSFIPTFENKAVNIAVPYGIAGVSFVGALAVKNPFLKTALLANSVYSALVGTRRVVNELSTPNAEGKRKMSEKAQGIIDKILPLGCPENPLLAGFGDTSETLDVDDYEIIETEDFKDEEIRGELTNSILA